MAATPQEGWFIAGIETLDGLDYYVIDNKMNMNPWLVDCYSQRLEVDFSEISWGESNSAGLSGWYEEVLYSQMCYRGFSDYTWRVDEDWVVKIWAESTTQQFPYQVVLYDRTQVPSVSYNFSADDPNSVGGYDQIHSDWTLQQDVATCIPFVYNDDWGALFAVSRNNTEKWTYWQAGVFQIYNIYGLPSRIVGSDINDIYATITYGRGKGNSAYVGSDAKALLHKQIAIQWLCPVDKAPSGMSVGDYWPKVRPLEVEMQEAMNEFEETMLANGQIKQPSDINTMFGQLGGMQEQGLGALEIGDAEAGFFTAAVSMMQPLFLTLLPIIGVGVILIIFANKGMHG